MTTAIKVSRDDNPRPLIIYDLLVLLHEKMNREKNNNEQQFNKLHSQLASHDDYTMVKCVDQTHIVK